MRMTIVDVVIDCPSNVDIKDVCTWLERGMLDGHRIMYVDYNTPMPKDIVNIPHCGHGYTCNANPLDCIEKATYEEHKYKRYFNIDLVVEGSLYLADLEIDKYSVLNAALLIPCWARPAPLAAESDRYELEEWDGD